MERLIRLATALALTGAAVAGQEVLKAWEFEKPGDAEGWRPAHSVAPLAVGGGVLRVEVTGGDPYLHASSGHAFDLEGNDFQYIEIRMRCRGGEGAEFFWADTVEGRDQGFVAGKERGFPCLADGQWHTYILHPLWQGRVTRLRFDPPGDEGNTVEVDFIRILQGPQSRHDPASPAWDFRGDTGAWVAASGGTPLAATARGARTEVVAGALLLVSPVLRLKAEDCRAACLELEADAPLSGVLCWCDSADAQFPGCNAVPFEVPAGASAATLRLTQSFTWSGELTRLGLRLEGRPGTAVTLKSLVLGPRPTGPGRLQIVAFGPQDAFVFAGQPGTLRARVENVGGEPLRGTALTVRTSAAGVAVGGPVGGFPAEIAPGAAAELTWPFTVQAAGPVAFILETGDGQRAQTEVVAAARPFPVPEIVAAPEAAASPGGAWIANDRVRLAVIRGQTGYARARLEAVAEGRARPMAVLPHLAWVQPAGAPEGTPLSFQEATAEQGPGHAALSLSGTTDVGGARVEAALRLILRQGKPYLDAAYELRADRDLAIAAFRGPWLWAGEGSFGNRKGMALFPGCEYLEGDERSSSTLDIAPPMHTRFAPHPNTITVPLMAVEHEGAIVGLMWDPLQKWDGRRDRPTAVFASPNFLEGCRNHLLGLCLPSIPDYLDPNTLAARDPYMLRAGAQLTLTAALYAEADSEILRSLDLYFDRYGVPELPPRPRSYAETAAMCLKAYEDVLWDEKAQGWRGVVQWAPNRDPGVALECCVLASRLLEDKALAQSLAAKGRRLLDPADLAAALHCTGAVSEALQRTLAEARAAAATAPADGRYAFQPTAATRSLGAAGSTASGICARGVRPLLTAALRTGDGDAAAAALRTLAFMERFRVPRASQVWECPVHTPDILAAADCCDVYLAGYQLTGDPRLLQRAVYWARTGLPFVYLWQAPEQRPLMKGASIAIFGASFYVGNWFARPVQWNGLAYAAALLALSRYDNSLPWRHFAEMIVISAMNQQSTRDADYGTYTDNWDVIRDIECVGCMLAPRPILKNILDLLEIPHGVSTAVVQTGGQPVTVNSGAAVEGARWDSGSLEFSLRYFPGETAYCAVMPVAEPARVTADGAELARYPGLETPPEGWSYDGGLGAVILKLAHGQAPRAVRIAGTAPIAPRLPAPRWEFDREGDAVGWQALHDTAPLVVKGGTLSVEATGSDPYIGSPRFAVPAAAHPGVVLRVRATRPGGELFFATDKGGFARSRSVGFHVPADGEFHEVRLDLSQHPEWTGLVMQLRLDFAAAPCKAEVDWVRLLGSE